MKYLALLLLFFTFCSNLSAQKTEILRVGDTVGITSRGYMGEFHLLEGSINSSEVKFIATVKATASKPSSMGVDDFISLYNKIEEKAIAMQANCFRLKDYYYNDSAKYVTLVLDLCYCTPEVLRGNSEKKKANDLYIFPLYVAAKNDFHKFWINNQKVKLYSDEYFKYSMGGNENVFLAKGAATEKVSGAIGQQPVYICFTGSFNISSLYYLSGTPASGSFSYLDRDVGQLLTQTLFKEPASQIVFTIDSSTNANSQKIATTLSGPPDFFSPAFTYGNEIKTVSYTDKKGKARTTTITDRTNVRIIKFDNTSVTLYFKTLVLQDSSIIGNRARFFNLYIKPIKLSEIRKIEIVRFPWN